MNRKNILASLGLVALLGLGGCMVRGSGHAYVSAPVAVVEVESEPPPPRYVQYSVRPGFIWIEGRWDWRRGNWVWVNGYYERERAGYVYAPGRWERRGSRHVYIQGRWNAGGARRDNTRYDRGRDRRRDRGPVIRDHR